MDFSTNQNINSSQVKVTLSGSTDLQINSKDVLLIAFLLVVQSAGISTEVAAHQGDDLKAYTRKEQDINNEMANEKFVNVPELIIKDKVIKHNSLKFGKPHNAKEFFSINKHGGNKHWGLHQHTSTTVLHIPQNQEAINGAQAENKEVMQIRQVLGDMIAKLQQDSQIKDNSVETGSDLASQQVQEGSSFLDVVRGLISKVLMRPDFSNN